ncbi:MAG: MmgE/PrpD family protein [Acidisphaera sp.]|nr:MmgE/PrpD family protein [Acidisphaera sp.]
MTELTQQTGAFIAAHRFGALPEQAVAIARLGFTDCLSVMITGRTEPVVRIVRETMTRLKETEDWRLWLGAERASAPDAALVNGVAAHALDYDDVALGGHPSAVLVPAILAEAEATGADGEAMVTAYVTGYEVWAELQARDRDPHHGKGWHPTAVFGVIAAAAAGASLRRLDAERAATAVGIAASCAAGLVANFGTMVKPFHAGRAARDGLVAARLAAAGMSAAPDALEHPLGFLAAISPHGNADRESEALLGRRWRILENGLNVKKYPICYATHRTIDAMLDLAQERGLQPGNIVGIEAELGATQAAMLRNHAPQTGLDAKFSEEFAMAAAVIARRVGRGELSDAFVRRPDVQALMSRVQVNGTKAADPEDPTFALEDGIAVTLAGGETLHRTVRYARGHAQSPLRADELWQKFRDCVEEYAGADRTHALFDALQRLERLPNAASLAATA